LRVYVSFRLADYYIRRRAAGRRVFALEAHHDAGVASVQVEVLGHAAVWGW
jgi:hypothetical protein